MVIFNSYVCHNQRVSTCLFSHHRAVKKVTTHDSPKGHGPVGIQGLPGGVGAHVAKAHRGENGQDLNSGSHVAWLFWDWFLPWERQKIDGEMFGQQHGNSISWHMKSYEHSLIWSYMIIYEIVFVNTKQIPSGYVKIAIENGHRNSELSH